MNINNFSGSDSKGGVIYEYIMWNSWASEVSPTLGCSIEISRDIYMSVCMYVCLSYVKSRGIT